MTQDLSDIPQNQLVDELERRSRLFSRWDGFEGERLDLSDRYFHDANLRGAEFWRADLRDAQLADSTLEGATLENATLKNATLDNASFLGASLIDADFGEADLSNTGLRHLPDDWLQYLLKQAVAIIENDVSIDARAGVYAIDLKHMRDAIRALEAEGEA